MCGIAGIWNMDDRPIAQDVLRRFTDSLAHRGPDGNGFYLDADANLGLGHRRLAIIDTSDGGRQPMSYADGRYWIVFNGEIYNFLELRRELEGRGCRFETDSDTEVILAAYAEWGPECQLRFNGMWAFAIWDRTQKRLFISRDRFGVKPLIYWHDGQRFAFASEMKAFLALEDFDLEFDGGMVAAALTDPELIEGGERCLLRGLKRLPGGHSLVLQAGSQPLVQRWWNTFDHLESVPRAYPEQVERYRELFLDACRLRMRSDVPIGTALSGGLDSSSIVSVMHRIRRDRAAGERLAADWQRAFVATYPGAEIDERSFAQVVIEHTGARPVYCEITPQMYLDNFGAVLFQFEEISDVHLGPWLVHRAQRRAGVVVTIDGHGGDEALGGYPWHITAALKDAIRGLAPRRAAGLVRTMKGLELFPPQQFYLRSAHELGRRLLASGPMRVQDDWLLQAPADFQSASYEEDRPRLKGRDALFQRLYVDFHHTQLPMNLRDFDRLSMAHGVEVRSPFMDWRLVTFTFSLPASAKIGQGFTKRILRDALRGILPESIRQRKRKLGFPNLREAWSSREAQEFVRDTVDSSRFLSSPIWDGRRIRQAGHAHADSPDSPTMRRIWTFVQAMHLIAAFESRRGLSA